MLRFYNILQYLAIKRKLILLLLLSIFINGILWLALIPIWHFPDEQAHFGQVAFIAETGRNSSGKELDLTEEIYTSEILLGTARDKFGNNKFTFHPEYKIEYTTTYLGKYEASISALTKTGSKTNFVHQEAARYPPLYYLPATVLYKLFYANDLFIRIFVIRFWSLAIFLGTVVVTFLMGRLIFPKNNLSALTLALLVGFQPMVVFANVGVNSDALGNFLFTLFLYLAVKILILGVKKRDSVLIILIAVLSIYSKPQFIVLLPLLMLLFLWIVMRDFSTIGKRRIIIYAILAAPIFLIVLYVLRIGSTYLVIRFLTKVNIPSLITYTREYTFTHTISEVLPWYWGVYDWLGVTYPRIVHRIINRVILIAVVGLFIWLIRIIRNKEWRKKEIQAVLFLNIAALLYFIAISFYDWLLWYTSKYPLGVQGRYFFPLISVHMLMLLIGIKQLFAFRSKLQNWSVKLVGILMIAFNLYANYTVAKIYYDIFPISTFIIQASQYKPWFFKGMFLVVLWSASFVTLIMFLIELISYSHEKEK